jgi:hypothetical protein
VNESLLFKCTPSNEQHPSSPCGFASKLFLFFSLQPLTLVVPVTEQLDQPTNFSADLLRNPFLIFNFRTPHLHFSSFE